MLHHSTLWSSLSAKILPAVTATGALHICFMLNPALMHIRCGLSNMLLLRRLLLLLLLHLFSVNIMQTRHIMCTAKWTGLLMSLMTMIQWGRTTLLGILIRSRGRISQRCPITLMWAVCKSRKRRHHAWAAGRPRCADSVMQAGVAMDRWER